MLEQWPVFLAVLWFPPEKNCTVYKLMIMIDVAAEVNNRLRAQARH